MYRHCIYCSAELGANEAVEGFPVGRTLAFDASKGRLWAVCGRCARWNLAPIEERWEAVEEAERLFHDARMRVQSENIGLARMPDGTRLIRIGAALAGELAAWRYGGQLTRRRRHLVAGGALAAAGVVGILGISYAAAGAGTLWIGHSLGRTAWNWFRGNRPIHTLGADDTPHGAPLLLRRKHLRDATLHAAGEDAIELHLPGALEFRPRRPYALPYGSGLRLPDRAARRVLERGLVRINEAGARRDQLDEALRRISDAGSAAAFVRTVAEAGMAMEAPEERARRMEQPTSLALEIALHEEQERRALEGELAVLEAAWRDAEPIAEIADRLAADPEAR